jgi:predicted DCC family thiol-disulfide oxidoreductase YuxK
VTTTSAAPPPPDADPVVLFDGVCNLCDATVAFIIDRDPGARFRFAALQSEAGRRLLAGVGVTLPAGDPASVYLLENGCLYDRSTAALRIARRLRGPAKLLFAFVVVPRPLRNLVYRFIARHRYRWFGRTEACRRPTPALAARFLA